MVTAESMTKETVWRASWIWDAYHQYTANSYLCFRKTFFLPSNNLKGVVRIVCACRSEYKLFINGRFLGQGSVASKAGTVFYDEYFLDVSDTAAGLKPAGNLVFAIGYNYGVGLHARPHCQAGFFCQIDLEDDDRVLELCQTDSSWDVMVPDWWLQNAPQRYWTTGFQEIVDLRAWKAWHENEQAAGGGEQSFSDSTVYDPTAMAMQAWGNAIICRPSFRKPEDVLRPRPIAQLKREIRRPTDIIRLCEVSHDRMFSSVKGILAFLDPGTNYKSRTFELQQIYDTQKPGSVVIRRISDSPESRSSISACVILDFEIEAVGYPVLAFESDGHGVLNIGYSEEYPRSELLDVMRQGIANMDQLTFGPGSNRWIMFNRRAFRCVELLFSGEFSSITLTDIHVEDLHYPFSREGKFNSSDPLLDDVFTTSAVTLDACIKESYEDCPLREAAQYLGDMRIQALSCYYAFGEYQISRKALLQFADEQDETGWLKSMAPSGTQHNIVDYLPYFVIALYEYYLYSGDLSLVHSLYGNAVRLMKWFASKTNNQGLLFMEADWWLFIDWADIERDGALAGLHCLVYRAYRTLASLAAIEDDAEGAVWATERAVVLKRVFNDTFWDENSGTYFDCILEDGRRKGLSSQTACLAVANDIVPSERISRLHDHMLSREVMDIRTGYFKSVELVAWYKLGNIDRLFNAFSYWQKMRNAGASTWWEVFDPKDIAASLTHSLCHAWSSGPAYVLLALIAGITPLTPGFDSISIQPCPGPLDRLDVIVPVPRGEIGLNMVLKRNTWRITFFCPEDSRVTFVFSYKWKMSFSSVAPSDVYADTKFGGLDFVQYSFQGCTSCSLVFVEA